MSKAAKIGVLFSVLVVLVVLAMMIGWRDTAPAYRFLDGARMWDRRTETVRGQIRTVFAYRSDRTYEDLLGQIRRELDARGGWKLHTKDDKGIRLWEFHSVDSSVEVVDGAPTQYDVDVHEVWWVPPAKFQPGRTIFITRPGTSADAAGSRVRAFFRGLFRLKVR